MFIKASGRIFGLLSLAFGLLLSACTNNGGEWGDYPANVQPAAAPMPIAQNFNDGFYGSQDIQYSAPQAQPQSGANLTPVKTVAVLLPLSGPNAKLGTQLKHAVEIAFFQRQPKDILVSFHDLSGNTENKIGVIDNVLSKYPDIVIGPIFAEDAKLIRDRKPDALPVLSFTSDPTALGRGVLSMALMPNQSVEAIVSRAAAGGMKNVLFIAPDNQSGYMNAASAIDSARIYGLNIAGLYYYAAGNTDSIKSTAERATLYGARTDANTRAKEILSNILIKEQLTPADKSSVSRQLNALNKRDTMGGVPYDSVLFLGTASDSKTMASFLRYYDLDQKSVKFFGTALWDSTTLFSDMTLAGSEYSSLPAAVTEFSQIFQDIEGIAPERIASMGYDAAMLAINTLQSGAPAPQYLLNPGGFAGLDGMFRLRASGANERALEIMELTGSGRPMLKAGAAKNFMNPIYQTGLPRIAKPAEYPVKAAIYPNDFITIPANLQDKYRSRTYGPGTAGTIAQPASVPVILPEDDSDVINDAEFQSAQPDAVSRQNIDEVEVY
ncbi:MAG: penicillin-binding protein activator [Proteobacteria bacterium]|nr:penicillin-binding protein activator [Pseudomonadota bacterium]